MTTLRQKTVTLLFGAALCFPAVLPAQIATDLSEGFEDVPGLVGRGWVFADNSRPLSTLNSWFRGETGAFGANSPPPDSYVGSSFASVDLSDEQATSLTLSNWLLTPELTLANGAVFRFFTRTLSSPAVFADRLQVRVSTSGASTDVGDGPETVGAFDFSGGALIDINEDLSATGYPADWTPFSITLSGLTEPTSGRFGFRHYLPNANETGFYIGIDDVTYLVAPMQVPEPSAVALLLVGAFGLAGIASRRRAPH